MMDMAKLHRCPRCQREVEGDFCPHCDLHYTERGVYRTTEEKVSHPTKAKTMVEQSEERVKHEQPSVFEKRELNSHPFSEEMFHKTVEEVLAETAASHSEVQQDESNAKDTSVTEQETSSNDEKTEHKPRFTLMPFKKKASTFMTVEHHQDEQKDVETNDASTNTEQDDIAEETETHQDAVSHVPEAFFVQDDEPDIAPETTKDVNEDRDEASYKSDDDKETSEKESSDMTDENRDDNKDAHDTQAPQLTAVQQQIKNNEHRQKRIIIIAVIVIILAIILGVSIFFWNQYQTKQQALKETEQRIEQKIDDFYVNHDAEKGFLSKDVTKANTQPIVDDIEKIQASHPDIAKAMQEKLTTLQSRDELEQKVNDLFVSKKIKGDKVLHPALKDNVDIQLVPVKSPKTAFDKAVNDSIQDAKDQQKQVEQANKAVTSLITDGVVSKEASMDDYQKAVKKVKAVKNKTVQNRLMKQMTIVKTTIDERKEQERLEKEEQKRQAEEAKRLKEAKKAQSKATQDPTNGKQEVSGDAYAWASGVKDKVIDTCISRGYITSDGYSLEKAYERNGEGYYNLYGTNNQSRLLKGYSPSQLPVYLVTINCKTGWFRGNGSR